MPPHQDLPFYSAGDVSTADLHRSVHDNLVPILHSLSASTPLDLSHANHKVVQRDITPLAMLVSAAPAEAERCAAPGVDSLITCESIAACTRAWTCWRSDSLIPPRSTPGWRQSARPPLALTTAAIAQIGNERLGQVG